MMAVILVIAGVAPGLALLTLPLWLLVVLLLGTGLGLMAGALAVSYRDVAYVVPVATQILLYASPVAYAVSAVPSSARTWYQLNPLSGALDGFRWALLNTSAPELWAAVWSAVAAVVLFVAGTSVFARMERKFADVI